MKINDNLDFLKEEEDIKASAATGYKVLVADDDEEVHKVTRLILKDFEFEGRKVELLHAYSGRETIEMCNKIKDIAVILLDVVMEEKDSGLQAVKTIREDQDNKLVRIIIRTGQPGQAPEEEVIRKYEINDYHLKIESTMKRMYTSLYVALRNYRDMIELENHTEGLKKVIEASAILFNQSTLQDYMKSVLTELPKFQTKAKFDGKSTQKEQERSGFSTLEKDSIHKLVAATGKFVECMNKEFNETRAHKEIKKILLSEEPFIELNDGKQSVYLPDHGLLLVNRGQVANNYIYLENYRADFRLIEMFLANFSVSMDNYIINEMVQTTQTEIVYALGETVESHFEETGGHTHRVTKMMYRFAQLNNRSHLESEQLSLASATHDLGKIVLPDEILKKPGKLTKEEYEIIKTHPQRGYDILAGAHLPILRSAAEIAYCHHEKYDGTGYPNGLAGEDIPESARMMAILDVFDALTHKRVYKDAYEIEEAKTFIQSEKGKHFDPRLVDLFLENVDAMLAEIDEEN